MSDEVCDVCGEPLTEPTIRIPEAARASHRACYDDEATARSNYELQQALGRVQASLQKRSNDD